MSEIVFKRTDDLKEILAYKDDVEVGKIVLSPSDTMYIIETTLVYDEFQGQGIGRKLVQQAVDLAIETNKKIIPLCPYAKKLFDETPEYQKVEKLI